MAIALLGVVGLFIGLGSTHDHPDHQPLSIHDSESHFCFLCHVSPNLLVEQDTCNDHEAKVSYNIASDPVEIVVSTEIDPEAHPRAPPFYPS